MVKARDRRMRGFTLIEAIVVIVITGIIASVVGVFIKMSADSYFDAVRRAELTDRADTALRRLEREVRLAVPNSLRLANAGNVNYLEMVPAKDGGRYRNESDGSTGGNNLCSNGATRTTFDVMGMNAGESPPAVAGDHVVVYNDASLDSSSNVYGSGGSRATVSGTSAATASDAASITTSTALGNSTLICSYANNRFQVVDQNVEAVTYACPSAGSGDMVRYWHYGFAFAQPAPPTGGSSALVAGNASCTIGFTPNALGRIGLLYIGLTLTDASGESVQVFRQIRVDNTP